MTKFIELVKDILKLISVLAPVIGLSLKEAKEIIAKWKGKK